LVINKPLAIIYIYVLGGIRTGTPFGNSNGEAILKSRFPTDRTTNTFSPGNTYFQDGICNQIEGGNPDLFNMAISSTPTG